MDTDMVTEGVLSLASAAVVVLGAEINRNCWDTMLIWSIIAIFIWSIIIWSNYCSSSSKWLFFSVLCFYTNGIHLSLLLDA